MSFTELSVLAAMVVIAVMFAQTALTLVAVEDMPKPPPRKTLRWVHFGLVEPAPWDESRWRSPDEIWKGALWSGESTGLYPMVFALKDGPDPLEEPGSSGELEGDATAVVDEPAAVVDEASAPKARDRFATKSRKKVTVQAVPEAPAELVEVAS